MNRQPIQPEEIRPGLRAYIEPDGGDYDNQYCAVGTIVSNIINDGRGRPTVQFVYDDVRFPGISQTEKYGLPIVWLYHEHVLIYEDPL